MRVGVHANGGRAATLMAPFLREGETGDGVIPMKAGSTRAGNRKKAGIAAGLCGDLVEAATPDLPFIPVYPYSLKTENYQ